MGLRFECDNRWDDFEGDSATARRCLECDHLVHNLSAMTRDEARELIRSAESRLCVTYHRRGDRVLFAEDLEKLEAQRGGVRQLVRAAAMVAPLLIAGCLDSPKPEAQAPEVKTVVVFGEESGESIGAATRAQTQPGQPNPEYVAYLREKQEQQAARNSRSFVDKLGDELERMMDEFFPDEEQKFDKAAVVAGDLEF